MRAFVFGALLILSGPALACDVAPVDFGRAFDQEAERQGSTLRVGVGHCNSNVPQSCGFTIDLLAIRAYGTDTKNETGRVKLESGPLNGALELSEAEPIVAALCSPSIDEAKRKSYLFALQTAYDEDEVAAPRVKVVLNGVRYLRQRLPDSAGELFEVAAPGNWTEEPKAAPAPPAPPPPPVASAEEPAAATTKEIVASYAPADFKVADPEDLFVAPRKFLGKPIEVRRFHCYYADVGDYRCVTPGYQPVVLLTSDVGPPSEKERLENECGTMRVFLTPQCERTLHLVVSDIAFDHIDERDRVVLKAASATIVPSVQAGAPRKKR